MNNTITQASTQDHAPYGSANDSDVNTVARVPNMRTRLTIYHIEKQRWIRESLASSVLVFSAFTACYAIGLRFIANNGSQHMWLGACSAMACGLVAWSTVRSNPVKPDENDIIKELVRHQIQGVPAEIET